jgi:hypothetical protein
MNFCAIISVINDGTALALNRALLYHFIICSSTQMEGPPEKNAQQKEKPFARIRIQRVGIIRQHRHFIIQG